MFQSNFNNPKLGKVAFEINIDPATVLGTIVGLNVAKKVGRENTAKKLKDAMSTTVSPGQVGYYQQVENLERNLEIVFTPLGVLYVLKEGPSELTIDNINLSEMSPTVRERYDRKDKAFFKNVMINKIKSDINIVERHFAKRMIERNQSLGVGKFASNVRDHFSEVKDVIEKLAGEEDSPYMNYLLEDDPIYINGSFSTEVDINKVASFFGEELKFPDVLSGLREEDVQGKLDDPRYLAKNSVVKYLPDRVLFIADGLVMAQLSMADMNDDGFKAFKNNDDQFFYRFFAEQLGVKKPTISELFKQASEVSDPSDLFTTTMIHPEVYFLLFNERFGSEWLTYDPEVTIDAVEREFMLTEPIHELVINKIWALQAVNNETGSVFRNVQAFEKMVRAMNSKPIDFATTQRNISLGEFVFALRVFQSVTPFTDVYDKFSPSIGHYIADVLAGQNRRLIYVEETGTAKKLFDWIDEEVRDRITAYIYDSLEGSEKELALNNDKLIAIQSGLLIDRIRKSGEIPTDFNEHVKKHWGELKSVAMVLGDDVENLMAIVSKNIEENVAVDVFVKFQEDQLREQSSKFIGL